LGEFKEISNEFKSITKDPKKRKILLIGVGVILLIFIISKARKGSSGSTEYMSGNADVKTSVILDTISALGTDLTKNQKELYDLISVNDENQYIYTESMLEQFDENVVERYEELNNNDQYYGSDNNDNNNDPYVEPVTPVTPIAKSTVDYDLISRLESDISRVSAKQDNKDTRSYFARNFGSIEQYLSSQQSRLDQARAG